MSEPAEYSATRERDREREGGREGGGGGGREREREGVCVGGGGGEGEREGGREGDEKATNTSMHGAGCSSPFKGLLGK